MWSETGYPSDYHDRIYLPHYADFLDLAVDIVQLPYLSAYSKHLHGFIREYTNY